MRTQKQGVAILWAIAAAGVAIGAEPQPTPPEAKKAADTDQPRIIVPSPSVVIPGAGLPLDPVRPSVPGTPASEVGARRVQALVRDGAFITSARARAVRGKTGRLFVVFDPDVLGRSFPPMVLLENGFLDSVERLVGGAPADDRADGIRLRVSGQVTVYRDRNFLMLTVPPMVDPGAGGRNVNETASRTAPDAAGAGAEPPGAKGAEDEPTMGSIIAELDRASGPRRDPRMPGSAVPVDASGAAQATGTVSAHGAAPVRDDRSEGFLVARRGRLIRSTDGGLCFRPDSGSVGGVEPTFALLPCATLASLDAWSDEVGDGRALTLSGRVYSYHGRRYLMPQMYTVPRTTDLVLPTQ